MYIIKRIVQYFRSVHKNIKNLACRLCTTLGTTYASGRKRTLESHLKKKHGKYASSPGGLEQFIERLRISTPTEDKGNWSEVGVP